MTNVITNPRWTFVTEEGRVLISADYSGQELMVAAVWSGDESMNRAFKEDEWLPHPDNKDEVYKNPWADLHTLSTVQCCFPELFEGQPEHLWVKIAKNEDLITKKGTARDWAKKLNFGLIYLQTAESMSQLYHLKVSETEQWVKNHQTTYPTFWAWAQEYGHIAEVRGWAATPVCQRLRYVQEANAKGAGESAIRNAINHSIQGGSSDMIKTAQIAVKKLTKGTPCEMIGLVHDEIVVEAPGQAWVNWEKSKKNKKGEYIHLAWEFDEEARHWGERVTEVMIDVETEMFARYGSDLIGRAEYSIARIWAH